MELSPKKNFLSLKKTGVVALALTSLIAIACDSGGRSANKNPERPAPPRNANVASAELSHLGRALNEDVFKAAFPNGRYKFVKAGNDLRLGQERDRLVGKVSAIGSAQRLAIADCGILAVNIGSAKDPEAKSRIMDDLLEAERNYQEAVSDRNRDSNNFKEAAAICRQAYGDPEIGDWRVPTGLR